MKWLFIRQGEKALGSQSTDDILKGNLLFCGFFCFYFYFFNYLTPNLGLFW